VVVEQQALGQLEDDAVARAHELVERRGVAVARGEGEGGGSGEVDAQARSRGRFRDGWSDGPRPRRDERNCQRGAPPRGGVFGFAARERGWARS
jgi:hypothetical protein